MAKKWEYLNMDEDLINELNKEIKLDRDLKLHRITIAQHFFEHKAREYLDERKKIKSS